MNSRISTLLALFLVLASAANAQLYIAKGVDTGAIADLDFTIDPVLNRVTLIVDNSVTGADGDITSLGFNVPTTLLGSISLVSETWNVINKGHAKPSNWTLEKPYSLTADQRVFSQDFGVITGTDAIDGILSKGIEVGEKVTFVFQFSDFSSAAGFLGSDGVTVDWSSAGTQLCTDEGFATEVDDLPIPEPSTYGLLGVVLLLGIVVVRERKGLVSRNGTLSV